MKAINMEKALIFEEVQVCPHCNALAKESRLLELTICSDGCGVIEGYKNTYKFECQKCFEICDSEECNCK